MTPQEKPQGGKILTEEELRPYWAKILSAIQQAPEEKEYDLREGEHEKHAVDFIHKKGGIETVGREAGEVKPHRIFFPDFATFRAVFEKSEGLSRVIPQSVIDEFIEHESDHLNKAKEFGYEVKIGLDIVKTLDGKIGYKPFVVVSVPDNVDQEEARKRLIEIGLAPKDLSEGDKKMTGN